MKITCLLSAALFACVACNNSGQTSQPSGPDSANAASDTNQFKVQIPDYACYIYAENRDTVALKVEIFPNVVTGVLQYNFYQKDGSIGNIVNGKLHGDTLIADYDFFAEGMQSLRQVVFLLRDSVAIAGYGDVEMKDDKEVFKNIGGIDFNNGLKLRKISCQEYDPAQHMH